MSFKNVINHKFYTTITSPLGEIYLASDGEHITGLWFEKQKYFPESIFDVKKATELDIFEEASRWLDLYFSGQNPDFFPGIKPQGTDFRHKVWDVLLQIPYGSVRTYGDIAKELGVNSAQAVGGAVGHNPISILIPCHRVVGTNGSLTGFAGGVDKKSWLLENERGASC